MTKIMKSILIKVQQGKNVNRLSGIRWIAEAGVRTVLRAGLAEEIRGIFTRTILTGNVR